MILIDLETWPRKNHFDFFYRMDYPQFNICMNLDITHFLKQTKTAGLSFYNAMVFASVNTCNEMDEFRYRIREGQVVLHEKVHPSFTYIRPTDENKPFRLITLDLSEDIVSFDRAAKKVCEEQTDYFCLDKLAGRDDLIHLTCIPWISFTHLSHTITINRNDSVPKISWGKYFREGDRILLPFSVQVHHALMDAYHIALYVEKLQNALNAYQIG